jgi:predicted transcriptional regulator
MPPRDRRTSLTPLQLAVMQVLWAREEASVADVQKGMRGKRLALTTVATLLTRRVDGRQYIYRARVSPVDVRQSVTRDLLGSLFHGDVTAFVTQLLDARDLTREEIADLKRLLRTKERA